MSEYVDFNGLLDEISSAFARELASRIQKKTYVELESLLRTFDVTPLAAYANKPAVTPAVVTDVAPAVASEVASEVAPEVEVPHVKVPPTVEEPLVNKVPEFDYDLVPQSKFLTEQEFAILPEQFRAAICNLPISANRSMSIILKAMPPESWVRILQGDILVDFRALTIGLGLPDNTPIFGNDAVRKIIVRVNKEAKIFLRQKVAATNLLRKKEAIKRKQEQALQKRREKQEADALRRANSVTETIVARKRYYTPTIDKRNRKKVGIIGVTAMQQALINAEYEDTFILAMADANDGVAKLRQVIDSPERKVYALTDCIAHSHVDLIGKENFNPVCGGMTHLRETLSNYARECYPE